MYLQHFLNVESCAFDDMASNKEKTQLIIKTSLVMIKFILSQPKKIKFI